MALNEDTTLYNKAFEKKYCDSYACYIISLRTIDSMWANQKQQENAFEIADKLARYMINLRVLLVI
jgi:DNA recombination protein RmuC